MTGADPDFSDDQVGCMAELALCRMFGVEWEGDTNPGEVVTRDISDRNQWMFALSVIPPAVTFLGCLPTDWECNVRTGFGTVIQPTAALPELRIEASWPEPSADEYYGGRVFVVLGTTPR